MCLVAIGALWCFGAAAVVAMVVGTFGAAPAYGAAVIGIGMISGGCLLVLSRSVSGWQVSAVAAARFD